MFNSYRVLILIGCYWSLEVWAWVLLTQSHLDVAAFVSPSITNLSNAVGPLLNLEQMPFTASHWQLTTYQQVVQSLTFKSSFTIGFASSFTPDFTFVPAFKRTK